MAKDLWHDDCEYVQRLLADVQRDITELTRLSKISVDTSRISVQIRKAFIELNDVLGELDEGLEKSRRAASITDKEYQRRLDELLDFRRRRDQLTKQHRNVVTSSAANPDLERGLLQPVGDTKRPTRVLGAASESDETRGLDNKSVAQLQQEKIKQQDQSLEQLRDSVGRIKQVAVAVNQELDEQKPLLENLENKIDKATSDVKKYNYRMLDITKKEDQMKLGLCCICCLIVAGVVTVVLVLLL